MSMNKVFEYCALGIPTACYPLKETKRLLGDAGSYAPTFDPAGLAEASTAAVAFVVAVAALGVCGVVVAGGNRSVRDDEHV